MKVIYTDSAKQALEAFKERHAKELEERICSRKYVFGDDTIEITASDIKEASEFRSMSSRRSLYSPMTETIMQLYLVFGALTTLGGLFYRDILEMLKGDPIQLMLVVGGIVMTFLSYIMLTRIKTRQQEQERIERIEKEKTRIS